MCLPPSSAVARPGRHQITIMCLSIRQCLISICVNSTTAEAPSVQCSKMIRVQALDHVCDINLLLLLLLFSFFVPKAKLAAYFSTEVYDWNLVVWVYSRSAKCFRCWKRIECVWSSPAFYWIYHALSAVLWICLCCWKSVTFLVSIIIRSHWYHANMLYPIAVQLSYHSSD